MHINNKHKLFHLTRALIQHSKPLLIALTIVILSGCSVPAFNTIDGIDEIDGTTNSTGTATQNQSQSESGSSADPDTQTGVSVSSSDSTETNGAPDIDIEFAITYRNAEYGFELSLPENWKGYSVLTDKWEGTVPWGTKAVETGPVIIIRHPEWTENNPRQDIPVMVFTYAQWVSLEKAEYHIGAAPMDPSELGKNSAYTFALPARYNYAFPTGYEEVEAILNSKAFKANEDF